MQQAARLWAGQRVLPVWPLTARARLCKTVAPVLIRWAATRIQPMWLLFLFGFLIKFKS
jgi:hypothetical protein